MTRIFMAGEAEGIATFWRIYRRDGVTIGLTSHDQPLHFDGVVHRCAPGMVPGAVRRTMDLSPDSAEVQGSLAHGSISERDLADGRFDGARILFGLVDWENLDRAILYRGQIGDISRQAGTFSADLVSAKALLDRDLVPRTSPACRAQFCGPGCALNPARYTHEAAVQAVNEAANRVTFADSPAPELLTGGTLRWLDGPLAGLSTAILSADADGVVPDQPLDGRIAPGMRVLLREGCDHRLQTCTERFGNAANFRGEPFLPGNDLLARYPAG